MARARAQEQQVVFSFENAKKTASEIEERRRYLVKLREELEEAQQSLKDCDEYKEVSRLKGVIADVEHQVAEEQIRLVQGLDAAGK